MIGDLATFGEDGRDDQVLGTRVGRALIDVQRLLAQAGPPPWPASSCRCPAGPSTGARAGGREDRRPASTPAPAARLVLTDPALLGRVGVTQVQRDTADFDVFPEIIHGRSLPSAGGGQSAIKSRVFRTGRHSVPDAKIHQCSRHSGRAKHRGPDVR